MPSCISSAVSPISRRMGWTQENSTRLTVIPTARLTRMDTPTTCTTFLCSFAPRYWEHRTDVPRLMTSKIEESEHDNLVDYPYGGNTVVRVAAQHDGVHRTEHHDEKCLYKNWGRPAWQAAFLGFLLYHCPCMCTIL